MEHCNNCNYNSSCGENRICVSSTNTSNAINITNNKARYYAELAEMYKNEAQEFRDSAQYYAEQNSDVTIEYVNQQDDALENLIDGKQAVLVSGTNIKTINSASILDSGNLTLADQDLSNLSSVGQNIIDGKADTDLSNLTATVSPNLDGQWISNFLEIANQVTAPDTTNLVYSLSSYLPNDNYNYEVLFRGFGVTGATSGDRNYFYLRTDIIPDISYVSYIRTRSAVALQSGSTLILPVGTARTVTIVHSSSNTGTVSLYALGYRRIGTNS